MSTKEKIEKIISAKKIDKNLVKLYNNPSGDSMNEFISDCKVIYELQKLLKKVINGYKIDYLLLINKYITLRNVFGIQGIVLIAVEYFTETEKLFEYFCSLVFYEDEIQISNRMSTKMLEILEKNEKRIFK
jgi:hypothetical protein